MTLRLVRDEPPKAPTKRRKFAPHSSDVFTPEEQTKARQSLRNMRDAFGSLSCMAAALGMPANTLQRVVAGSMPVSAATLFRASRASGLSTDELLGAPSLAGTCRACGSVRRAS